MAKFLYLLQFQTIYIFTYYMYYIHYILYILYIICIVYYILYIHHIYYIYKYMLYIHVLYIYIYIYIYQFESHLMMCWIKTKKVLKTHLFGKIFRFLYRRKLSVIKNGSLVILIRTNGLQLDGLQLH